MKRAHGKKEATFKTLFFGRIYKCVKKIEKGPELLIMVEETRTRTLHAFVHMCYERRFVRQYIFSHYFDRISLSQAKIKFVGSINITKRYSQVYRTIIFKEFAQQNRPNNPQPQNMAAPGSFHYTR